MADQDQMTVRSLITELVKSCNMDATVHISFMGSDTLPISEVDEEDEGLVILKYNT